MTAVPNRGARAYWLIARHFIAREIAERWLGSFSGAAWALLAPVAQLLVLLLVFGTILKVRLPDADPRAFVPFLVAGLWPWAAFSEAVNRGVQAIPERAALLAKVALPRTALVLAPVAASFLLNGLGFVAVVAVVALAGFPIDPLGLVLALPLWLLLGVFAFGLALALGAVNVYVRDTAHVLPQVITLWFYLTPIFYPRSIVPGSFADAMAANPMTAFVDAFRAALTADPLPASALPVAVLAATAALLFGFAVFRRTASRFEDFL